MYRKRGMHTIVFFFLQYRVVITSGSTPKQEAIKKSRALSKYQTATISIRGPGTNSASVGMVSLKRVFDLAINPWGSASSKKCAKRAAADASTALCESSMGDGMISTVIKQDTAI
jgi:hypothetical protein